MTDANDGLMVITNQPVTHHTYYVSAEIRARVDWSTKQVEVTGLLGIAPNDTTVIEYPVHVWNTGFWNKTETRKIMSAVKRRLVAEMQAVGYGLKDLTEPISVIDRR